MDPARIDLAADRGLWFVSDPIVFTDDDFTGSTFHMQVRQAPDAPGDPYADLETVTTDAEGIELTYVGTDTVANHIDAGRMSSDDAVRLGYATTDTLTLSIVIIRISDTTIAGMPPAPVPGQNVDLAHDILVTLPANHEQKYFYGTFTLRGTVTQ